MLLQEYSDLACIQAEDNAQGNDNIDYDDLIGKGIRRTLQFAQLPTAAIARLEP